MSRTHLGRTVPVSSQSSLPFIDAHAVQVDAPPEEVWAALVGVLPRAFGGRGAETFARMVGCDACRHEGAFPELGSQVVGFHVAGADPLRHLSLHGGHRFASYELAFHLEPSPHGTRLSATTHARFPGLPGRLYRLAVIGTRGHVLVVRRMLRAVRRRAERAGSSVAGQPS